VDLDAVLRDEDHLLVAEAQCPRLELSALIGK
jgi:hypothetical protein